LQRRFTYNEFRREHDAFRHEPLPSYADLFQEYLSGDISDLHTLLVDRRHRGIAEGSKGLIGESYDGHFIGDRNAFLLTQIQRSDGAVGTSREDSIGPFRELQQPIESVKAVLELKIAPQNDF